YVKADIIEESVIALISQRFGTKAVVEEEARGHADEVEARLRDARKRLTASQKRMDDAVDRLGEGDDPEWERQRDRLLLAVKGARADVEHLASERRRILDRMAQAEAIARRAISFAEEVDSLPVPTAKARLQTIVKRVLVYDRGERAEVEY